MNEELEIPVAGQAEDSLSANVCRALKMRIVSMELEPGTRLSESALVNQFEVSRTPIREALHLLDMEGLVKITPGVGAEVARSSFRDVIEAYTIRELLDPAAAEFCAERIGDERLMHLEELINKVPAAVEKHQDAVKCEELNRGFHKIIFDASGNYTLASIGMRLIWVTQQISVQLPPRSYLESRKEHMAILECLRIRDSKCAKEAMKIHIKASRGRLLDVA